MIINNEAFNKAVSLYNLVENETRLDSENINDILKEIQNESDPEFKSILLAPIFKGSIGLIRGIIAKRIANIEEGLISISDLVQQSFIALTKSIEDYDFNKSAFSTYATVCITNSLKRYINNEISAIRLPENVKNELNKLKQTTADLTKKIKRQPTHEELAKELNTTHKRIEELLEFENTTKVLVDVKDEDNNDIELVDKSTLHKNEIDEKLIIDLIENKANLNENEKLVIKMFYGIGYDKHTLSRISEELNIDFNQVKSMQTNALYKLRKCKEELK